MMLAGGWLEPEHFPAWRRRVKAEFMARNLTHARREALQQLMLFVGDDGLFPSDQAVADKARCSARTVRRARVDAKRLGLLNWSPTRKLVAGRYRQGPNHYTLTTPDGPVCPGGQKVRRIKKDIKQEGIQQGITRPPPLIWPTEPRVDLLAARRAVMEERLRRR